MGEGAEHGVAEGGGDDVGGRHAREAQHRGDIQRVREGVRAAAAGGERAAGGARAGRGGGGGYARGLPRAAAGCTAASRRVLRRARRLVDARPARAAAQVARAKGWVGPQVQRPAVCKAGRKRARKKREAHTHLSKKRTWGECV